MKENTSRHALSMVIEMNRAEILRCVRAMSPAGMTSSAAIVAAPTLVVPTTDNLN